MSKPAVSIQGVSKAYRIGVKEQIPRTVFGALRGAMESPFRNFNRLRRLNTFRGGGDEEDLVWALKDVSFDVAEGEVVGIIGNNGAGKSTLLKILSRITEPTRGQVVLRGRVSSLLEVGTGFHPEMTGRENVYMNGTILGMTKREIDRKFDEIVDFSGIEKFLDTPVKRYSSGMSVRLAFAVAAHLEPEILIIDEVLAVGDAEFQTKCIGKMQGVAQSGRTVLFVSHNLAAVESLCSQAVLLEHGRLTLAGSTQSVLSRYTAGGCNLLARIDLDDPSLHCAGGTHLLRRVLIEGEDGVSRAFVAVGQNLRFIVRVGSDTRIPDAYVAIRVNNANSTKVLTLHSKYQCPEPFFFLGTMDITCTLENCRLAPGRYSFEVVAGTHAKALDETPSAFHFDVVASDVYGTGKIGVPGSGMILPECKWSVNRYGAAGQVI